MKKCPKCGLSIEDDTKFCPHCGFNVTQINIPIENEDEIDEDIDEDEDGNAEPD